MSEVFFIAAPTDSVVTLLRLLLDGLLLDGLLRFLLFGWALLSRLLWLSRLATMTLLDKIRGLVLISSGYKRFKIRHLTFSAIA